MSPRTAPLPPLVLALLLPVPLLAQGTGTLQATGQSFYVPFNDVQLASPGGGPALTLNGSVTLDAPLVDVCLGLEPGVPASCAGTAQYAYRLRSALALEFAADATGPIEAELPLGKVAIATLAFDPGSAVSGTVWLQGKLIVRGEVAAGLRASLFGQLEATGQVKLGKRPVAGHQPPQDVLLEFSPPEISGGAGFDLEVAFEGGVSVSVNLPGLPSGEPFLRARSGVHLAVDPLGDPWWDADGIVEVYAGWGPDLVGGSSLSVVPTLLVWDLLDAGGPLAGWQPEPVRWSRAYDVDPSEDVTAVQPIAGGYVVVGNTAGVGSRGWVARLDEAGAVVWEQRSSGAPGTFSQPVDVHLDGSGEVVVGGAITGPGARIDRYALDGTPLASEVFSDANGGVLTLEAMVPTSDGGLAFCGSVQRLVSQSPGVTVQPFVVRLDSTGVVLWASELALEQGAGFGHGFELVEGAGGELFVAGDVNYNNGGGAQPLSSNNAMLFALDDQGGLLYARALGTIGYEQAVALAQLEGGDVLVAGSAALEQHSAWVARVDALGGLVWSRTIAGEGTAGPDRVGGIAPVPGGALLAGHTGLSAARDAWMLRLDVAGGVQWFKSLRGPHEDQLVGLRALSDGLVAWGMTRSVDPLGTGGDQQEMWLARTAHDGMLQFDPANGFDALNDLRRSAATTKVVSVPLPGHVDAITVTSAPAAFLHAPTQAQVTQLTQ